MVKPQSPCYECPRHKLGCRTDCEEWAEFEAEVAAWREARQEHYKKGVTEAYVSHQRRRYKAMMLRNRKR